MDGYLTKTLHAVYDTMFDSEMMDTYSLKHNINAAPVLTIVDDEKADLLAAYLEPRIRDKTVIEIGGGLGLLALHMGQIARRVYCIEANPLWASCFIAVLLKAKPKNVSYLFGAADEFVGMLKGDVAVVCTCSDLENMKLIAAQFAPVVIDPYGELINSAPDKFDPVAVRLRELS